MTDKPTTYFLLSLQTGSVPISTATDMQTKNIHVLFGPEGGFTTEEEFAIMKIAAPSQQMTSNVHDLPLFTAIHMGNRVLRTETAGLAALVAFSM